MCIGWIVNTRRSHKSLGRLVVLLGVQYGSSIGLLPIDCYLLVFYLYICNFYVIDHHKKNAENEANRKNYHHTFSGTLLKTNVFMIGDTISFWDIWANVAFGSNKFDGPRNRICSTILSHPAIQTNNYFTPSHKNCFHNLEVTQLLPFWRFIALSTTGSLGTSFPLLRIFTAKPFFADANKDSLLIHSGGCLETKITASVTKRDLERLW